MILSPASDFRFQAEGLARTHTCEFFEFPVAKDFVVGNSDVRYSRPWSPATPLFCHKFSIWQCRRGGVSSGGEKRLGRPRGRDSGPSFPCRPFEVGNSAGESFRVTIRSLGKWVSAKRLRWSRNRLAGNRTGLPAWGILLLVSGAILEQESMRGDKANGRGKLP